MNRLTGDGTTYVLGHSEQELARLERQGAIFGGETRDILLRAGLKPGMHVLDVGSGAGDVALAAAEIVGPQGSVLGIDRSGEALSAARARAERGGYKSVTFTDADVYAFDSERRFDAVVGRFVLMHVADAVGALRRLKHFLKPGGIVAFVEMDIDETRAVPDIALLDQCIAWITATYRKVGAEPNMGSHLYAAYKAAGMTPDLIGLTRITSADDRVVFGFAAQSLTSLLPAMEKFGVATKEEVGIDTVAERLIAEASAGDHAIMMPRIVGAWARVPG